MKVLNPVYGHAAISSYTTKVRKVSEFSLSQTLAEQRRKQQQSQLLHRLSIHETTKQQIYVQHPHDFIKPLSQSIGTKFETELRKLPESLRAYVEDKIRLVNCSNLHVCDGSETENEQIIQLMRAQKMIKPLKKYKNCWLARTDPRDTARVESRTFICTRDKRDMIPQSVLDKISDNNQKIVYNSLGNWMHVDALDKKLGKLLQNCMSGRTMYVLPFSMGKIGGKLSKIGVQITDSPYVVASMRIMTRVSDEILKMIEDMDEDNDNQNDNYVRCFHSVGAPLPLERELVANWPCNPDETIISHIPERNEIVSYGSGYGGNSLLGKKCFALRFGTILGCKEGWLAEHMLILSITNEKTGSKKYIAAAFPSACGKTNLAMLNALETSGYSIKTAGDDICWLRRDGKVVRGMNPEKGFFGVAPGTSEFTNPNAMATIQKNTIFTNVAETSDGDFYWEGLEHRLGGDVDNSSEPNVKVTSWLGEQNWSKATSKTPAAHPNSRFCAPIDQCPTIDDDYELDLPISAILFGTRRPDGVPLVYESYNWQHGVYLGSSMRSESTAAAEHKAKTIMHDPMAQRPFLGVKFDKYLNNWLKFGQAANGDDEQNAVQLPKIFHVNWFRKHPVSGKFLWPGFRENIRVLDYIFRRLDGEQCARETPIGLLPKRGAINLSGLDASQVSDADMEELLSVNKEFWLDEQAIVDKYLRDNDAPSEVLEQSEALRRRLLFSSEHSNKQTETVDK